MTQHTPGPWHVGGEWPTIFAIYHGCTFIAHAETGVGKDWIGENPIGRERAKANARLIAAAPTLLTVLKAMCPADAPCSCDDSMVTPADTICVYCAAKIVIAAAEAAPSN